MFDTKEKGSIKVTILVIFLLTFMSGLFSQSKKVKVAVEDTGIYLEPNVNSTVLGTVAKGDVLTLLSRNRIKMKWFYVIFTSEEGIKKSGYIRASFIDFIELVPQTAKSEEIPKPEKKRYVSVKAGASYFYPSEKRCRDVYSAGMMVKAEINFEIWKDLSLWIGGGYFSRKGKLFFTKEETELQIIPVGAGVKYTIFKNRINVYSGAGLKYYQFKETNPLGDVNKVGFGFVGKIGAFVLLGEGLIFDLCMDYSYCKMKPATRSINVGGFEVGAGIGYRF
jgi:hypothetical protein